MFTITTSNKIFRLSITNNSYIKDTLIDNYFNDKIDNINLNYSNTVIEYLLLIFQGKIIFPENEIEEFSNLLKYIGCQNIIYKKYSEIIKSKIIMDCIGRWSNINLFRNKIFSINILNLIFIYNDDDYLYLLDYNRKYFNNLFPNVDFSIGSNDIIIENDGIKIDCIIRCDYYYPYNNDFEKDYAKINYNFLIKNKKVIKHIFDTVKFNFDVNNNFIDKQFSLIFN